MYLEAKKMYPLRNFRRLFQLLLLCFLTVLIIPFLPLSLHVLRLIHPLLPVPHHRPVQPPVLLLDHHDAQLVLLVLKHLLIVVIVQLGHCAHFHPHAAFLFLFFSDFFILFFFVTINLIPITLLLLFFLFTILFDTLFKLLLLWWNIVSNPSLSNERRQMGRKGLTQRILSLAASLSPVDRVKDPLRLDIESSKNLVINAWSVTYLVGDCSVRVSKCGTRSNSSVPADLSTHGPHHEHQGLPGHLPAQEEPQPVEELAMPLARFCLCSSRFHGLSTFLHLNLVQFNSVGLNESSRKSLV